SNIVKILDITALLAMSTAVSTCAFGQSAKPVADSESRVVLNTMADELQRNFDALKKKADPPPYFLSYEITDQDAHTISASLGVLNATESGRNRYLDVTVRVGDPKLDNFRRVRGERVQFTSGAAEAGPLARNGPRLPHFRRTAHQDQNQSAGQSRRSRYFERFLLRRELR